MRGCRLSALLLSPFALLRERDMDKESEEAQKLELIRSMREEGMTLKEIAESLGYKDHSAVSKLLKRNSN